MILNGNYVGIAIAVMPVGSGELARASSGCGRASAWPWAKSQPMAVSHCSAAWESTFLAEQWMPSTLAACTVATTIAWASLSLSALEVSFGSIFTRRSDLERSSGSTCESKEKSSITTQAPTLSHCVMKRSTWARRAQRLGDLKADAVGGNAMGVERGGHLLREALILERCDREVDGEAGRLR